jgi:3'(2'), 5'-bisphosphate nucleotidase/myo-inositol-1(or 4)-monophosphatase
MELSAEDLSELGQYAISAACRAGRLIARYAQSPVAVNTKDGGASLAAQVVTEVDHLSQDIILQVLRPSCAAFDLALLSEESPDDLERLDKKFFWCIDPLDGTLPFIEGVPGYSVSVALVANNGAPVIGVVYDPLTDTLYHAIKSQGIWRNQQVLAPVVGATSETQSLLFITDKSFAQDPRYPATLVGLQRCAQNLGYQDATLQLQGGAALNACQVLNALGTCYFKFPKPQKGGGSVWDYAATACLFEEFGAAVSDMQGNKLKLNPAGSTFMNQCGVLYCSEQAIAEQMIQAYRAASETY